MRDGTWLTVAALAVGTFAIKGIGPLALGGRVLPRAVAAVIGLLSPAILAALIVVGTFTTSDGSLELDARAGGLAAAAGVYAFSRKSLVAAAVTAAAVAGEERPGLDAARPPTRVVRRCSSRKAPRAEP